MNSMRAFWEIYKDECIYIRSIDEVYSKYLIYVDEIKETEKFKYNAINKYIFRTFIRKNGYNNSPDDIEAYIKEKENKKIAKRIRKAISKKNQTPEEAEYEIYITVEKERKKKSEKMMENNLTMLENRNKARNIE